MYCTRCGRKLEEGEICTCRQGQNTQQMPHMRNEQRRVMPEHMAENLKNADWAKEKRTQAAGAAKDIFNKCSKNSPTSSGGEMNCTSEHICSKNLMTYKENTCSVYLNVVY